MTTTDEHIHDTSAPTEPVAVEPDQTSLDDSSTLVHSSSDRRRTLRRITLLLSLLSAVLLALVIIDRRPAPRPTVEIVDQGGALHLAAPELAAVRAKAATLPYPVTIVLADHRSTPGDWDRSLSRLGQPNRLVIGLAVEDRALAVARGAVLPLTASEELAIEAAAQAPLRSGDAARALDYALVQAALLGSPYPPAQSKSLVDGVAVQLALSLIAPCAVLAIVLSGLRRRLRTRLL